MMELKVYAFAAKTNKEDYLMHEKIVAKMDLIDFVPCEFNTEPTKEAQEDTFTTFSNKSMDINPTNLIAEDIESPHVYAGEDRKET